MFSVIIPVYNTPQDIFNKCIESLAIQKYKPEGWEVILVDDCSINMPKVEYDIPYKIIHNQKNMGPGASRQIGLEAASNDYVLFIDSDDYYVIDDIFIDYCIGIQQSADVIYISQILNALQNDTIDYHEEWSPDIWGRCFNKNFLIKYNIYFPAYYYHEDWCVGNLITLCNPKYYKIDKPALRYVAPSGSLTDYSPTLFAIVGLLSTMEIVEYFQQHNISAEQAHKFIKDNFMFVLHTNPDYYPFLIMIASFVASSIQKYTNDFQDIFAVKEKYNYEMLTHFVYHIVDDICERENQERVRTHLYKMIELGNKMFY